jgi:hypothetical protein
MKKSLLFLVAFAAFQQSTIKASGNGKSSNWWYPSWISEFAQSTVGQMTIGGGIGLILGTRTAGDVFNRNISGPEGAACAAVIAASVVASQEYIDPKNATFTNSIGTGILFGLAFKSGLFNKIEQRQGR